MFRYYTDIFYLYQIEFVCLFNEGNVATKIIFIPCLNIFSCPTFTQNKKDYELKMYVTKLLPSVMLPGFGFRALKKQISSFDTAKHEQIK